MTLSNYQATLDFIKIFDMFTVLPETYNGDMLQQHRDTAKLRYNLIHEEVTELREAIRDRDFVEVIDALTDILYVVYGAGATSSEQSRALSTRYFPVLLRAVRLALEPIVARG